MDVNRANTVLLLIVAFIAIFVIVVSYNGGCSPNTFCMGPRQITIFTLPFSQMIFGLLFVPLILSAGLTFLKESMYYVIKKPNREVVINRSIRTFCVVFIIISIITLVLQSMIQY